MPASIREAVRDGDADQQAFGPSLVRNCSAEEVVGKQKVVALSRPCFVDSMAGWAGLGTACALIIRCSFRCAPALHIAIRSLVAH